MSALRHMAAAPSPLRGQKPKLNGCSAKKRTLIIAHNHPHYTTGGAEIFARDLAVALREHTDYGSFLLAGFTTQERPMHGGTSFAALPDSADEMLFHGGYYNYFMQSQDNLTFLNTEFAALLQQMQPDIVHFQHIFRIGVEAIALVKRVLPNAKILLTLHEYMFICHREGQMITTQGQKLCNAASPKACNSCFPEYSEAQFALRKQFIQSHMTWVDAFISPSHFLAQRYIAWGLPKAKFHVLENGRHMSKAAPARAIMKNGLRNHFAYFGQINPFKGVLLAINALEKLVQQGEDVHLSLFGSVEQQSDAFKQMFKEALKRHKKHIHFHGCYNNNELPDLMEKTDWVIVPSTWWENSPLVIQEAFMHRRPVICSNIGGMAEKVQHGVNGLHFDVGNAADLAQRIKQAMHTPAMWESLSAGITPRLSMQESAQQHAALYNHLRNA